MADVTSGCIAGDGSCGPVPADAPLPLCERHLAIAADWASRAHGVTDVLPVPCRLCGSRLGVHYPSGWLCAICEWRVGEVVDGELPPPRIDVVYYLRFEDRVKIGTTGNPKQRFAALWHEEVLAFERGGRPLEQRRHAEFADDRLGTSEWFALSPAILRHIESLGAEGPWDRYARWMADALALRG